MDPAAIAGHPAVVDVLDRLRARRLLQRAGLGSEPTAPLHTDPPEVARLLSDEDFAGSLRELAGRIRRDENDVRAEAAASLREMAATHNETAGDAWQKFGKWILRAYDVIVDEDSAAKLRDLDRKHSLIFLPSHRSYLDAWVLPHAAGTRGLGPSFGFGGGNLNFFPFGTVASRTGMIFIRRDTTDAPVYRQALRSYIGELVRNRSNLGWMIEGGRTRTGKLRPPKYGILRYVIDAVQAVQGPEIMVVPVSIVYDQLHEVAMMAAEAHGGRKRPEDIRWLVQFAREQRQRLGRAYVDFGDPLPLREQLAELRVDDPAETHSVERVALAVCHRINRATPVTTTAVVCLALLGADRALALDEVLATIQPLADYVGASHWPVAGAANLTDRSTIRRTLQELVASGVLNCYEGGTETVWGIGPQQHLVAAFYRNTAIHILVDRSIGELATLAASEGDGDPQQKIWDEALKLRDLLKFEFFFARRRDFSEGLMDELRLIDPDGPERLGAVDTADLRGWLERARPPVAHLVLRPFLDAYYVVAERLASWDDDVFDEARFLDECLRIGKQWVLQRRLSSAESVTLELFGTALRLAKHRGLVESDDPHLSKRRQDFAEEVRQAVRRAAVVADLAKGKSTVDGSA